MWSGPKGASVQERLDRAQEAKKALLERFKKQPGPGDKEYEERQAQLKAIAEARRQREECAPSRRPKPKRGAPRKRASRPSAMRARPQEAAERAVREAAEAAERKAREEAEFAALMKAEEDARRMAIVKEQREARKAAKKKKKRGLLVRPRMILSENRYPLFGIMRWPVVRFAARSLARKQFCLRIFSAEGRAPDARPSCFFGAVFSQPPSAERVLRRSQRRLPASRTLV